MTKGLLLGFATIQSILLAAIAWVGLSAYESWVGARDSLESQERCDQLAKDIQLLRQIESVAKEGDQIAELNNAAFVALARENAISEQQIRSIQRLNPTPIEGTDYERHDVFLDLRGVTMQAILQLILDAEESLGSIKATSIQLTASGPARQNRPVGPAAETWNAQLILTQLVFVATRPSS